MSGIRATVTFTDPGECPIARFSKRTGATVDRVSTSVASPGRTSVSEFLADVDADEREPLFSYGSTKLYRISHGEESHCPCACLGRFDCPVHRYSAADGELTLVFHASGFEQLQDVMEQLRAQFAPVDVKRLLQPPLEGGPREDVFVNRGKLTDRQLEVLKTAYEMGYFDKPKRANATEVAAALDITQSTLTEHLTVAQSKIFEDVLEERT